MVNKVNYFYHITLLNIDRTTIFVYKIRDNLSKHFIVLHSTYIYYMYIRFHSILVEAPQIERPKLMENIEQLLSGCILKLDRRSLFLPKKYDHKILGFNIFPSVHSTF